ncbi:nucleotidyltransferase domain-containing protein [Dyadobacter chenwenxiniae]|uniref:Nucleotidyltransferase domain-containing protein n=1 Tax=Dyadobacter chenwenxiniae TaxID=2906456 RepID=A0A9X1PJR9_9BACT|nr:nucleotidyltransferase domain-containing protein [Dyadobacter chenwenxiniae]MCF0053172.1 nucleotidyltransferase domain-containing protein [Dyadobacter chenwenxiniae]MCF0061655.1 nucleotidyltransferase domain-containing protein [Dyadobacter chenwenxiniae]UON81476.1 nucleotidyltransferase domain-containing protein [Dyadobacter chenwenxiniae]
MDQGEAIIIAQQYVDLVNRIYPVKQAFLFGSFARGNSHLDSDIDIALVLDRSEDIMETQIAMMKLRRDIDLRIEPHPFIVQDFQSSNPVAYEIMKYGIEIGKAAA